MAESYGASHRELSSLAETTPVVDTGDIDIAWELADVDVVVIDVEGTPVPSERARAMMPTLHEEDPLRYDLAYRREHAARDSMPTLPDIDPLSYDVPDES